MPANAGLNIVIRDEGSNLPGATSVGGSGGGGNSVGPNPQQAPNNPSSATAEQEADMAAEPGKTPEPGAPKPAGFTYAIDDAPPAGFPIDITPGDGMPPLVPPAVPPGDAPIDPQTPAVGGAPIPVMVMNDPLRVMIASGLQALPTPAGQEVVDLELVDEDIIDAELVDEKKPDDAKGKDGDASDMQKLLWLLQPLVYGQQGRGGGGPLGAIEHGLGAVRGAALKFTGPQFGGMLATVGGAATNAAAGMAPGMMASAVGGAGGLLTGAGSLAAAAGPAGLAIAGLAAAAGAAVLAVDRYTQVLTSAAEELKNFSPDLQIAYDLESLRNEMRQLERGSRFGEDLAGFVETKGEVERAFKDGWDEVLKVMLDIWTEVEPAVRESLNWTRHTIRVVRTLGDIMEGNWLPSWLQLLLKVYGDTSEYARKILNIKELENELKNVKQDPLAELFIEYGKSLPPGMFPAGGPPTMGGASPLGI